MSGRLPSLILVSKLRPHILIFLIGFFIRMIPELISPMYPVGYETITYYAPPMFRFGEQGLVDVLVEFFESGPLLYVLLWFGRVLSGAHPFIILKVVGPLLYGGLAVSFLVFLKRGLNMKERTAFVGALLLVSQIAALRIAWDRFRSMLGLAFVFITLTALKTNHRHRWWLMSLFSVLAVLSREYIGFLLFVAVLGSAFLERKDRAPALIALTPFLVIFVAMVYPARLWWNYIPEGAPPFASGNYLELIRDVFSIFVVCYLPLLFFVMKGFRREKLLDPMIVWMLLGSFSVVVSPWLAVPGYQRWLVLLVFPFSIYAARSFESFRLYNKGVSRKLMAVILVFMTIGLGYSSGTFSYVGILSNSWVPVNLVQSSIAWEHVDDVKGVLEWLDNNAVFNSSVLAEERFYGWTLIYLKRAKGDVKVVSYEANFSPQTALERTLDEGYQQIYLIWYTGTDLENFRTAYSLNSVSIFQYE